MKTGENGPISYLRLLSSIGAIIYAAGLYKGFWFDKKAYLKLIRFLDENSHLLPLTGSCRCWVQSTAFAVSLCLIYSCFTIYYGTLYSFHRCNWSPKLWFKLLVAESRYTFLFETKLNASKTPVALEADEPSDVTALNILLAFAEGFALQFRLFTSYFGDLIIFVNVLSLFIPLVAFTSQLRTQIISNIPGNNKIKINKNVNSTSTLLLVHQELKYYMKQDVDIKIKHFLALKTLSDLIGNTVGILILPFMVEVMFHYPGYFNQVLVAQEVTRKLRLMFYFTTVSIIFLLSSEMSRNIRWFRCWIGERRRLQLIEENVLASVLHDLRFKKVGITAAGMFCIDYDLVGAVASLSVTFFIVRLLSSA